MDIQKVKNYARKIGIVLVGGLMIGATIFAAGCTEKVNPEPIPQPVVVQEQPNNVQQVDVQSPADNLPPVIEEVSAEDQLVEEFNTEIADEVEAEEGLQMVEEEPEVAEEEVVMSSEYVFDELHLNEPVAEKVLSDKQLKSLLDGKVEFGGDDYNAEEVFVVNGLKVVANKDDMGSETYLQLFEGSLAYSLIFEDDLNVGLITSEDTLKVSFSCEDLEISEWNGDEITFTKGTEHDMIEGESLMFEGKEVSLKFVSEDYAYVEVDGVGKKVYEGDTKEFEDFEVRVKEILYQPYAGGVHAATLEMGKEVEVTVADGDEYEEDSPFRWSIVSDGQESKMGLVLAEDFIYADEDEDFKALAMAEKLVFPNNCLSVKYDGLAEEEYSDYEFELDMKHGLEYVKVDGEFTSGLDDFDRVYVNATGIYDEDLELISDDYVELDDSDWLLKLEEEGTLRVGAVVMDLDLEHLWADGEELDSRDEDYRTEYGTIVESPDDNLDDNKVELSVPEDQVEASVSIFSK